MGVQLTKDAGGTNEFRAYVDWVQVTAGIAVENYRYVARACNIDSSAIAKNGTNAIEALIETMYAVEYMDDSVRWAYYVNRTLAKFLHHQARTGVSNATLTIEQIAGKPVVMANGFPIRVSDALPPPRPSSRNPRRSPTTPSGQRAAGASRRRLSGKRDESMYDKNSLFSDSQSIAAAAGNVLSDAYDTWQGQTAAVGTRPSADRCSTTSAAARSSCSPDHRGGQLRRSPDHRLPVRAGGQLRAVDEPGGRGLHRRARARGAGRRLPAGAPAASPPGRVTQRWVGMRYVIAVATTTTGKVTSGLNFDRQTNVNVI
jgi:hypothetical protein